MPCACQCRQQKRMIRRTACAGVREVQGEKAKLVAWVEGQGKGEGGHFERDMHRTGSKATEGENREFQSVPCICQGVLILKCLNTCRRVLISRCLKTCRRQVARHSATCTWHGRYAQNERGPITAHSLWQSCHKLESVQAAQASTSRNQEGMTGVERITG